MHRPFGQSLPYLLWYESGLRHAALNNWGFDKNMSNFTIIYRSPNNLDQREWDVVHEVSPESFERVVDTAVLAANLHRLGRLVCSQEQKRAKRRAA